MKILLSWLREYVEFDVTAEKLADRLTAAGIEVTSLATFSHEFPRVVIGEVTGIEPHFGDPSLRVCRVNTGQQTVRVVCGAQNFKVGDKVPFAAPDAVLPSGQKIRPTEIGGVLSEGMLCAEDELGLTGDHSGLMVLPEEAKVGAHLSSILGSGETVLDVEVTWNRPDCLSVIGLAREVSAILNVPLQVPTVSYAESGPPIHERVRVTVEDIEGCSRYTARLFENVSVGPAPFWMRRRLTLCGLRPLSNVVDITNYVMLEYGQPLHAFDYDTVTNHHIIIRRARDGEYIRTLDGTERHLTKEVLVIADAARVTAIAGVMGGEESGIGPATCRVLLESACFDPASIHRASLLLGMSTDASHRFERGVDILGADVASRRAAQLIVDLTGATAARGMIDVFPRPPQPREITYRFRYGNELLGIRVPRTKVMQIFERLGLAVVARRNDSCTVRVPSFRGDLELEADLAEEVARIHGLDKIPTAPPVSVVVPGTTEMRSRAVLECRRNLTGLGLSEILNYSFVSERLLNSFRHDDADVRIVLPNPVSADHAVLRNSLIPQMVETLRRNLSRQVLTAAFFEIGRIFLKNGPSFTEEDHLCVGLMGPVGRKPLDGKHPVDMSEMFMWLKGVIEAIFRGQHVADATFTPVSCPFFEEGWAVRLSRGHGDLGFAGLLRENLRREWRFLSPVGLCELRLTPLLENAFHLPELQPISPFPAVTRDLAVIVDESVQNQRIVNAIRVCAPPELTGIELFDIFRSEAIGQGRKSLAYTLTYRAMDRTLTDDEANRYHQRIMDFLKAELKAEIRESKVR